MNDEPKSPAELKEIRLNRKLAQDAEGIKAMADIAAADIAIRKRTANLRAMRLAKEAADRDKPAGTQGQSQAQEKEDDLDDERRSQPRRCALQQGRTAANDAKTGKTEREIAAKAVLDNMAKLKALRLAREAAEPPRPATVKKTRAKSPKKSGREGPGTVGLAGGSAKRRTPDLKRHQTGAGHSIIDRVLVAAS